MECSSNDAVLTIFPCKNPRTGVVYSKEEDVLADRVELATHIHDTLFRDAPTIVHYPPALITFVGHGRAGKDEAADYVASRNPAVFRPGAMSLEACPAFASALGVDQGLAYRTRHKHRLLWFTLLNEARRHDPSLLTRFVLRHRRDRTIMVGIRAYEELYHSRHLLGAVIWIEREGNAVDPTLEFGMEEADLVVYNDGSRSLFRSRLEAILRLISVKP